MATTTNALKLCFKDSLGEKFTTNVSHVDSDKVTEQKVIDLTDAYVANKTLFKRKPNAVVSAQLVTTTVTDYDVG